MSEKAEWERLLDDSYQWRIGQGFLLVLALVSLVLAVIVSPAWFVAECLFLLMFLGFRRVEWGMVKKAIQLRKEQEDERTE